MQDHPDALIREKEGISAIWFIPAIALVFGVWLMIKAVLEQGLYITVQFETAVGMVEGKTEVRYKGLPVGKVVDIAVSEDLKHVDVEIEMAAATKPLLTDKSNFWFVTADVSFQGVSGLDTLFSGGYISVLPDINNEGEPTRQFIALKDSPMLNQDSAGLHLILKTDTLGSLAKNSPVSFKQMRVGHVSGYQYDAASDKINVMILIEPEYAHLVKENSIFWNSSGFEVTGSLTTGLKMKTDSLGSIISGGIAFDELEQNTSKTLATNGTVFNLHPDFQTAEMGHEITLYLDWNTGVDRGSIIQYQGLALGVIDSFIKIDPEERKITALAKINPRVAPYLTEETQFYVVSPKVDLGGITNMNTLFKGSYISLQPSLTGEITDQFKVYNSKPPYRYDEPGLHLVLTANNSESIRVGTGVFYRKQQVGSVQAINNKTSGEVLIHIHIDEKYQDFVVNNSHFWNTSGLRISGGIQNFELQAHSVQSMLTGGIAFDAPNEKAKTKVINGDQFVLFDNKAIANQRVPLALTAQSARGLNTKTRIMYQGETVGSIHQINRDNGKVRLNIGLSPNYEFLLKEKSQFWIVRPSVSLAGLNDTDALFGGTYINVNAGEGQNKSQFALTELPPAKHISSTGLQLTLITKHGNVVHPGSPITYRGILVGQVDNVSLSHSGEEVKIHITINDQYAHLVNHFTRFYNASGITLSGGLTNFAIRTESTDSLLRGGISFFNADNQQADILIDEGEQFTLFDNIQHAEMAGVAIKIHFKDIAGLTPNLKIKYQDQQIGLVTRVDFEQQGYGATVYAFLNDNGKKFAVSGSQFWLAKTQLGLVGSTNVNALLEGGFINVLPGKGASNTSFIAEDIAPVITELPYGLNLQLTANKLGSIRVGNPVLYRQVNVGRVLGVDLASTANKVNIYINIAERYAPLVNTESQFWNTSGVKIDASLFSGVKVDSESLETLLSGGIAFATPESVENNANTPISQGHQFTLNDEVDNDWLEWSPLINISDHTMD